MNFEVKCHIEALRVHCPPSIGFFLYFWVFSVAPPLGCFEVREIICVKSDRGPGILSSDWIISCVNTTCLNIYPVGMSIMGE